MHEESLIHRIVTRRLANKATRSRVLNCTSKPDTWSRVPSSSTASGPSKLRLKSERMRYIRFCFCFAVSGSHRPSDMSLASTTPVM